MWSAIGAVALILGLVSDATNLINWPPTDNVVSRLNGDLNIAVSDFEGSGTPNAQSQATQFSQTLVAALRRRAARDHRRLAPVVEVFGPENLGELSISGSLDQRELDHLNATIGISGKLRSEPQETVLSMVLRINAHQFHLARPIAPLIRRRIRMRGGITESISTRIRIRDQVVISITLIENLLLGLGELQSGHPDRSLALLHRVLAGWSSRTGREALYLLRGHALVEEHRDAEARASYRRALEIHPGYARARFSLAALDFPHAADDCTAAGIRVRAMWSYRDTFDAIAKQTTSTLHVKAQFARARAEACLSQAGLADRFNSARATFERVVAAYRDGTPEVRAEAAESLGWLALIALPTRQSRGSSMARAAIAKAVHYYRRAASLAIDPSRRRFFAAEARRWIDRMDAAGGPPA